MTLIEKIHQVQRIDDLIRRKATGSPKELASRLEISERAVYDCIELMKNMNAPIYYCRSRGSYCYENQVRFSFGFIDSNWDQNSIRGGKQTLTFDDFFRLRNFCSEGVYV